MQQQRNIAAAVAQPQADYKRQLQVQLQKQQAVFDKQLQQLSAGWEQQWLAAQYSHEALNSARERAEQQLQEVKAACQHWQRDPIPLSIDVAFFGSTRWRK